LNFNRIPPVVAFPVPIGELAQRGDRASSSRVGDDPIQPEDDQLATGESNTNAVIRRPAIDPNSTQLD
jgi:hypothetical protein